MNVKGISLEADYYMARPTNGTGNTQCWITIDDDEIKKTNPNFNGCG